MDGEFSTGKRNLNPGIHTYIPVEAGQNRAARKLGKSGSMKKEDLEKLADDELLDLIIQRRREALEALYDRFGNAVFSLAVHILRDVGAAEEVTQDTFFNVWRRAPSYDSARGKVSAWLFSIGHHRIIDELRRRKRRDQSEVSQDVEVLHRAADDSSDPALYLALQMQRSQIHMALAELRPEQREAVMLAYYGGLTHTEIAARLQQPLGTVKTRMRLALKRLRELMGNEAREIVEDGL
ncbi:MAG: sigma-70 family RNA polymerase sigma factor [SAR202 cluster bacterium]|nr:sigma-70 family RNA polymerase sigma factor [SAR202 cluster bacterium]